PDIEVTTFHYGATSFDLDTTNRDGGRDGDPTPPLMAPRRTDLDRVLVDAAMAAGADVRHRTKLVAVNTHPSGRVTGVEVEDAGGGRHHVGADLVIGADGLHSTVARHLDVPITRLGTEASAYVISYFADLDLPRNAYQWLYGPQIGAGIIPTGNGEFAIFAGAPRERFRNEIRHDTELGFHTILGEIHPEFAAAIRAATPTSGYRAWPGRPGQFRRAFGPGWALVGDAGYFKDPFAAHGISDALRDAELVSEAVVGGDFATYERLRNELSTPLFDALEQVASYRWTLEELPALHLAMGKAMSAEQKALDRHRADRPTRRGDELPVAA
ncbi:MAG: NAD(P)/FAD-dependent oxidoreductase, partial [Actinomycetota bacterium]